MRKLSTCLLIVLFGGLLLAGCGKSSSTSSTETITTGSQASGASTSSGGTTAPTGTSAASPQVVKQQVAICKQNINAVSKLSASAKAKLEASCEKAGASATAQRKVVHELCRELASRLPAGVARERALAVCRAP
jgi:hypothetical protein